MHICIKKIHAFYYFYLYWCFCWFYFSISNHYNVSRRNLKGLKWGYKLIPPVIPPHIPRLQHIECRCYRQQKRLNPFRIKPFVTALECSSLQFGERGNKLISVSYWNLLLICFYKTSYTPIYTPNKQKYPLFLVFFIYMVMSMP